jgi:hypothetical protein
VVFEFHDNEEIGPRMLGTRVRARGADDLAEGQTPVREVKSKESTAHALLK